MTSLIENKKLIYIIPFFIGLITSYSLPPYSFFFINFITFPILLFVVFELKKNKTSDKAVGQLTRYMGWIKKNKKDDGVKGIIVAGRFDDKLDHARIMIPNCEVFLYDVIFKLSEYKK